MGFLLVGTYWPWSGGSAERPEGRTPSEGAPRQAGNARVRAVVRTHDGRLLKFTEVPRQLQEEGARVPALGVRQRTRHGVSLVFPSVHVSVHI